jgi:hypothetical protein
MQDSNQAFVKNVLLTRLQRHIEERKGLLNLLSDPALPPPLAPWLRRRVGELEEEERALTLFIAEKLDKQEG